MDSNTEILAAFRSEAVDHLDSLERRLRGEKSEEPDGEIANTLKMMFISVHTIKGGSAMLGMNDAWTLSSAMEDVLFELRAEGTAPSAETASLLLQGSGLLRALVLDAPADDTGASARSLATRMRSATTPQDQESGSEPDNGPSHPAITIRHWRGLIVDASPTTRMVHAMVLKDAGYQVDSMADGPDAIRRLTETDYDIMVVGPSTRNMTTHELASAARAIRSREQLSIVLTGTPSDGWELMPDVEIEGRPAAGQAGRHELLQLARSVQERRQSD